MTPTDLEAWQVRLGITDAEAARRLGTPYLTYREWLPSGRRRRECLPGWLPILCRHLEAEAAGKDAADISAASLPCSL